MRCNHPVCVRHIFIYVAHALPLGCGTLHLKKWAVLVFELCLTPARLSSIQCSYYGCTIGSRTVGRALVARREGRQKRRILRVGVMR